MPTATITIDARSGVADPAVCYKAIQLNVLVTGYSLQNYYMYSPLRKL